ncbi:hypothetical protein RSO01_21780 [Reyranella soli]|uniref:SGNH hydrolase-type esterase domain-containing protein n=2 Tax=Reyranella soli TaxID=1230389 RepID=A0A512N7R4_9HYPH|nr:hypothetical protein RSO01_21780 [Reyranella soli]
MTAFPSLSFPAGQKAGGEFPFRAWSGGMRVLGNIALVVVAIVVGVGLIEIAGRLYFGRSLEGSYYVYGGAPVQFDAVSGFRLRPGPIHETRITRGQIEYVGLYKPNSLGFQSSEFAPQRQDGRRRIAVFGDSFSQADYLARNWPSYVEATSFAEGHPLQLLNFSLGGTGLANWWSILKNMAGAYELDGVVFAVWEENLYRQFLVTHSEGQKWWLGRVPSWDPARYPKTLDEAMRVMAPMAGDFYFTDESGFLDALSGEWRPREARRWFVERQVAALWEPREQPGRVTALPILDPADAAARERQIADIAAIIAARQWRATVAYIPSRPGLLDPGSDAAFKAETLRFAEMIGASFHDGSEVYAGMSDTEIRRHFLPYDAHWNLAGSDLFGRFMLRTLSAPTPQRLP